MLSDRYRLERLLGTGGMAAVWLARDARLGRPVAVKVLSEVLALDQDYIRRFAREAQIAAGLHHQNLVRVFDFDSEGERPYLAMEYIDGGTLAQRDAGSVDPRALAAQLLGALAHIHSAGVLHRDIKPANVLIDAGGNAHLTDFGIARPENATRITQTGEVIGTLRYMAPEVREGRSATQRSDLYSCGVVIREQLRGGSAPELAELTERLTLRDPDRRPRSAADALRELQGESDTIATEVAVTEPAATEVLTDTGERGRRIAPVAALSVLAGIAAAVVLLVLLLGRGGSEPPAASQPRSNQAVPTTTITTTEATQPVTRPAPKAKPPKPKKPPKQAKGVGPGGEGPPGLEGR